MRIASITVTPEIGTDAYTANDVVGGLMTFPVAPTHGGGIVHSMLVTDDANQKEPYALYLFDAAPTTIADDAAFAPLIADLQKIAGVIALGTADWTTVNGNAYALLGGHEDGEMKIHFVAESGNLYLYAVAADTPDYAAATDLSFTLILEEG